MIIIHGPREATAISSKLQTIFDDLLGVKAQYQYTVEVSYVDSQKIKSLNKQYRQINKSTDVLSFPLYSSIDELPAKDTIIGDLVICPEQTGGQHLDLEACYIHGILHLLGYDHEKDPKSWQDAEQKIT